MRVVILAAGAAGMYCGSCMRDNRLAATLIAQGRDVMLIPLYTPLRTDDPDVSTSRVLYSGVNVFLQQKSAFFRRSRHFLDRVLDSRGLLRFASLFAGATRPENLGDLTVSILHGSHGLQQKEVGKLIDALEVCKPDVVNLPDLMFLGVVQPLKEKLGCKVLCTLSGEDLFVDGLPEPHRSEVNRLIEEASRHVDGYLAVTKYYADHAAARFKLPRERIHYTPMGINVNDFAPAPQPIQDQPFVIGYLARICEAKGLANLAEAFSYMRSQGRRCRLRIAGYLGRADRGYWHEVRAFLRTRRIPLQDVDFIGEVNRNEKLRFLNALHVLSVPTKYPEAKGLYILEALACGVPVAQPRHGSFPELIEATGGGLLYEQDQPYCLAKTLSRLMDEPPLRKRLAGAGLAAVREKFTDKVMAETTWTVCEQIVNS